MLSKTIIHSYTHVCPDKRINVKYMDERINVKYTQNTHGYKHGTEESVQLISYLMHLRKKIHMHMIYHWKGH